MRKIVAAVMATFSGLVLLFSYHTSTNSTEAEASSDDSAADTTVPTNSASSSPSTSTASSTPSTSTTSATPAATTSSAASSGTYTGTAINTQYGNVQVRITVANGKVTASEAIQYPNRDHKDQEINSYAIPILSSEAVTAQSASIDAVSGATFTSQAYKQSLQSALDQAHL